LFIVGKDSPDLHTDYGDWRSKSKVKKSQLSRLDEICVKADLIQATRLTGIPEFSGDGEYLVHYSVSELTNALGTRRDDVANTFTARLLLLLESRPLIGEQVYSDVIKDVISAYYRDYEDHKDSFMPAFLSNDILRLWRTFCVNYEAGSEREPEEKKIKGKLKNYKLKHSRLLTCFSGIIFVLNKFRQRNTVDPDDIVEMTKLTPVERLTAIQASDDEAKVAIDNLKIKYEKFLGNTNRPEQELLEIFSHKATAAQYVHESYEFGDSIADVLKIIGTGDAARFLRLLLV
jgi:hypothetical protein